MYNYFQTGIGLTAAFTGGMTSTMKCFVAGTMVATINGLVVIENIKAGDLVLSTDPETMKTGYKPVVETYITTQRISPASAGVGFYLSAQSEYNLRLFGQRFCESPLLLTSRALNEVESRMKMNNVYLNENNLCSSLDDIMIFINDRVKDRERRL